MPHNRYVIFEIMAEISETEKPKARRTRKAKEPETPAEPKIPFWKDERSQKVAGLFLLLVSVLLLLSFTSFIFSSKSDLAEAKDFSFKVLMDKNNSATNIIGWLGAWISFVFFFKGFGFASYLFLPVIFVAGLKLIYKEARISLVKTIIHCLPALLWISITVGLISSLPFFSGAFGVFVSDWSARMVGATGTTAILAFLLLTYLVVMFNIDFRRKRADAVGVGTKVAADGKIILDDDSEIREWEKAIVQENVEELKKHGKHELILTETESVVEPEEDASTEFEVIIKEPQEMKNKADDLTLDIQLSIADDIISNENDEDDLNETEEVLSLEPYDPTLDLANYKTPPLDMLQDYGSDTIRIDKEELERNKNQIIETLKNYGIEITRIKATIGPTVTLYEIVPAPGVRISKIKNLEDDIALSLLALGIRIIAPIPGKGTIGIEVPNVHKEVVSMKSMLASEKFQQAKMDLPIALGKTISNEIFIADLAKMPHLLMAGATGQGKSVGINSILVSLLYKKHPAELKFVMVDPKKVELSLFKEIEKHYLAKLPGEEDPIITDTKKVVYTLNALCVEMDNRYDLLKEAGVRNIKEYNAKFIARRLNPMKGHQFLPYIILVVDEFADLMMTAGKEVETPIARLAQLARAIGIHLVIATQRPSVNIITGVIKANFPARIAFKVTSKVDSRTILDASGADQLIGRGDMLFSNGGEMIRLQCGFVDTPEVEAITEFIGKQQGYPEAFRLPEYEDEKGENMLGTLSEDERDPMFEEAARIIVTSQMGSTSMLQRKLKLGYNRAGRLMDQLEQAGIVGPNLGSKAREVMFKDIAELEQFLKGY
jgi:DNA segregation ATPase FtsK/SpoIIIE, S-DNA-T family